MSNVLINGRTAVHAGSQGTLTTVDVCWTKVGKPTIPIPYTNIARSADADKTASTVFVNGNPVCHKDSIFSKSTGDQPGNRKGIRSGTITEKAEFIQGSSNVFIEGIAAVRQGDLMVSNNCNTPPMPLAQPGAGAAASVDVSAVQVLEEGELPYRMDIGQCGEEAILLKGEYRTYLKNQPTRTAAYIDESQGEGFRNLGAHSSTDAERHLALVLRESEHISMADTEYGTEDLYKGSPDIVIPLGDVTPRSVDTPLPEAPDEFDTFTAPLIIKRHTTAQPDKAKGAEVRTGWLYIYRNGYLWRELMISSDGFLQDVNFHRFQGQHVRRATGEADSRVIVPWKVGGEKQQIEIAFSEVQWSWDRINAMGGMNPDREQEPRLKDDTPVSTVSESEAAQNRQARMQDITDELEQWILGGGGETENLQIAEDVTADIDSIEWFHRGSKMSVLFVKDTLGLARGLADKAADAALALDKLRREDAHKRTVADIAQSILKSYPGYDKHLRSSEDMQVFCHNFDAHQQALQTEYNQTQDDLIAFLRDNRPEYQTLWQDYAPSDVVSDHQESFEHVWHSLLAPLSPLPTKQGETEEPSRLAQLLGDEQQSTPEGDIVFERICLTSDRLTGHTDNLLALLANWVTQKTQGSFEGVLERYRLSRIEVVQEMVEIPIVGGHYLDLLPKGLRWGAAINAIDGTPVTALKGGAIVVPQLFVGGKAINTIVPAIEETVTEITSVQYIQKMEEIRLRQKAVPTLEKVHKGLVGLQVLNLAKAGFDLKGQFDSGADAGAITAYTSNLISDLTGLAAMSDDFCGRMVKLTMKSYGDIAKAQRMMLTGHLNIAAGLTLAVFEGKMAVDEWQSGDTDAAIGRGTMALGGIAMAIGRTGLVEAVEGAALRASMPSASSYALRLASLARFTPALRLCGWVGVALTVGGIIYTLYADNNPLEDWLTHCAFGTNTYEGKGTITNADGEKEHIEYAGWKDNPGFEIAAAMPLIVGYVAEGKWTDNTAKLNNHDYRPLHDQLRHQPQGFDLKVTVPPFTKGKVVLQLSFFDDIGRGGNFFPANTGDSQGRSARSYQQTETLSGGSGPQPIRHTWGIGVGDIPPNATKAIARLWFDPYGDGRYLLPNAHGLELTVHRGSAVHVGSI